MKKLISKEIVIYSGFTASQQQRTDKNPCLNSILSFLKYGRKRK